MSERDWREDIHHENGRHLSICTFCAGVFAGHKRRVVCKACATERNRRLAEAQVAVHKQDDERAVELDALRTRVAQLEDALREIALAAEFDYRRGPIRIDPGEIARRALSPTRGPAPDGA